ncbi:MAG: ABC transporter permease [Acidobacteriota bacterium]|jgi:Cu-processing system permease protein
MKFRQWSPVLGLNQMWAIAVNSFREAVRSRIFYILMAFTVVMVLFSVVMSLLTVGSRSKIVIDLGLTVISFLSVMTAVFVGIGLVYQEVEKKTIYNVLSKPISRARFILGRYLGLMGVLFVNVLAMILLLAGLLLIFGGFTTGIFEAAGFIYLELAIITAIAVFFSSITSPVVSAICTIAFYIVGHTSNALTQLLAPDLSSEFGKGFVTFLYHVLPDLNILNVTDLIAYKIPIAEGFTEKALIYTAAYVVILLTASCMAFRHRDLV